MKLVFGSSKPLTQLIPPTDKLSSHSSLATKSLLGVNKRSLKLKPVMEMSRSRVKCSISFVDHQQEPLKIGNKWMEYQGCNDWEGLLDPLDDNLRGEILRYGEFVEAAYRAFDFDPSSPTYAMCKYPKNSVLTRTGISETGYRVTRNLRATSGVQLPRWAEKAPSWISTRSSWIGYVAVCQDKKEIQRLGRRDVVIALRGTGTCLEWIENLRATLTCLHGHHDGSEDDAPMVESGFFRLYTSKTSTWPSLQDMIREEIARLIAMYGDEPLSFTITGHSLGAALATLTAYDIGTNFVNPPMVTVVSFGGPRVGNRSFRRHLERSGTKILRIVNSDDVVTKVPGFLVQGDDDEEEECMPDKETARYVVPGLPLPGWFQKSVQDTRFVYADVGRELRLSSRESPHLSNGNMATCHELKTYLHLVRGFVSSTCPVRATAKRMLRMQYVPMDNNRRAQEPGHIA